MKNERLYLTSWEYNAALILKDLAQVVENNGGEVLPPIYRTYTITNRTLSGAIKDKENRRAKYAEHGARVDIIDKDIDALKAIKNEPVHVDHLHSVGFIFDNVYYYYSVDDNPFFDFHYMKIKLNDGAYYGLYICDNAKKDWLYDCFLSYTCSAADRREAANLIFNDLMQAPYSKKSRSKKRVPNYYDGGYHYEYFDDDAKRKTIIKEA